MAQHPIQPSDPEQDELLERTPAQRAMLITGSGLALVALLLPPLLLVLGMLQQRPAPQPREPAGMLS